MLLPSLSMEHHPCLVALWGFRDLGRDATNSGLGEVEAGVTWIEDSIGDNRTLATFSFILVLMFVESVAIVSFPVSTTVLATFATGSRSE